MAASSLKLRYSIRRNDVKFSDQDHCLFQCDGDPKIFKGPNFLSFCLLKLKNTQINLPLVYYWVVTSVLLGWILTSWYIICCQFWGREYTFSIWIHFFLWWMCWLKTLAYQWKVETWIASSELWISLAAASSVTITALAGPRTTKQAFNSLKWPWWAMIIIIVLAIMILTVIIWRAGMLDIPYHVRYFMLYTTLAIKQEKLGICEITCHQIGY